MGWERQKIDVKRKKGDWGARDLFTFVRGAWQELTFSTGQQLIEEKFFLF